MLVQCWKRIHGVEADTLVKLTTPSPNTELAWEKQQHNYNNANTQLVKQLNVVAVLITMRYIPARLSTIDRMLLMPAVGFVAMKTHQHCIMNSYRALGQPGGGGRQYPRPTSFIACGRIKDKCGCRYTYQ